MDDRHELTTTATAAVDVPRPQDAGTGSATGTIAPRAASSGGLVEQVSALPSPIRLQMQLIARQSSGPDEALAPIIALLVDGSPQKRAAIVTAFRTSEPLREQWARTFEILRS